MQSHAPAKESASHANKPFFSSQPARATSFFSSSPAIQTKLTVGESGDCFEREADAAADRVVQRMDAGRIARATTPAVQAACAACAGEEDKEEMLQAKGLEGPASVPASVEQNLRAEHAGHSLAPPLQAQMEQAFQADFSSVRVHTGGPAERLNQELHARAFTHGNDIYFNAGEFAPDSRAGQHLLAHELTHVVQQSRPAVSLPSVQRDGPKPGSPADKLATAKNELKAKYGLKDISEQGGAGWTENQLKKIAASFSRMSTEEQKRLQGVTLVLTDNFPSKTLKGKTFTIAGKTYGTYRVELTPTGVRDSVLHEAGHLIHNNAIANAEKLFERSQFKADLEVARDVVNQSSKRRFSVSADQSHISEQLKAVTDAAATFERSGDDNRKANREALEEAEMTLPLIGSDAASQALSAHVAKVRAFVAALLQWSDEREKAVSPVKRLDEFVSIVNKHRLARRSAIFTPYAEANWPDKPGEFFAEAYDAWRKNPAVVKGISTDLVKWFERGGHLGPNVPPPRQPVRVPIPTTIPVLHQNAPVIEELLLEVGETFLPVIEGGVNLIP